MKAVKQLAKKRQNHDILNYVSVICVLCIWLRSMLSNERILYFTVEI